MLSASTIKILAAVCMLIDHLGASLGTPGMEFFDAETTMIMRIIGRISFPVYAYFIANGYIYTRNKRNYFVNLTAFAFVSQIPYTMGLHHTNRTLTPLQGSSEMSFLTGQNLAIALVVLVCTTLAYIFFISDKKFEKNILWMVGAITLCLFSVRISGYAVHIASDLNVFYTLAMGMAGIYLLDNAAESPPVKTAILSAVWLGVLLFISPNADYGIKGVLFIMTLFIAKSSKIFQCIVALIFVLLQYNFSSGSFYSSYYTYTALAVIPLILLYNGKKGITLNKYMFYGFYPVHLLLIGLVIIGVRISI